MAEEWRPIPGLEGRYEASTRGRIRSLPRERTRGGVLSAGIDDGGYPYVGIREGDKVRRIRVHELVAVTYLGERPADRPHVCHDDGDEVNCAPSNLYYGTPSQNIYDQVRHGTHPEASRPCCDHGHEYTRENTWVWRGTRYCRTCRRSRRRARKERTGVWT